jgi:hypothetical protein
LRPPSGCIACRLVSRNSRFSSAAVANTRSYSLRVKSAELRRSRPCSVALTLPSSTAAPRLMHRLSRRSRYVSGTAQPLDCFTRLLPPLPQKQSTRQANPTRAICLWMFGFDSRLNCPRLSKAPSRPFRARRSRGPERAYSNVRERGPQAPTKRWTAREVPSAWCTEGPCGLA